MAGDVLRQGYGMRRYANNAAYVRTACHIRLKRRQPEGIFLPAAAVVLCHGERMDLWMAAALPSAFPHVEHDFKIIAQILCFLLDFDSRLGDKIYGVIDRVEEKVDVADE